jgi:hypothetical protein
MLQSKNAPMIVGGYVAVEYGGELRMKEQKSVSEAIERFLSLIIDCKEPAVFSTFIRALKENGTDYFRFCFSDIKNEHNNDNSMFNFTSCSVV